MKKATFLVLLLVAGFAAASAITVTQRVDTLSIFAERFDLAQSLVAGRSTILPALGDLVATDAVEIAAALGNARTAIAKDHWTYAFDVKESTAPALASGTFVVTLFVDNVPRGAVVLEQRTADAAAIEGARVAFDLGPSLPESALYYVEIKPRVATGETVTFILRSTPAGDLKWEGVGAPIDGLLNPTLTLAVGSQLRLTARNADGIVHDIGIKDAPGALASPPGWSADVDEIGEEVTLSWTPQLAGTYSYQCKYHAATMRGTLTVA